MTVTPIHGLVLRVVGGFYRVALGNGSVLECSLSGRLKPRGAAKRRAPVLPGDQVWLEECEGAFVVREVLPRTTELIRPAIANVDTCVVVQSVATPPPNLELIDRMLVLVGHSGMNAVICLTKCDLATTDSLQALMQPYQQAGYPCYLTAAKVGMGIAPLAQALANRVTTLAGPSGVGKSRLLNALCPSYQRVTGEVSQKIERGRHTTRQVELLPLPQGGWVADTPGFSVIEFGDITPRELPGLYPEFRALAAECRFNSCLHRGEPGCAVAAAVSNGDIDTGRYQRYLRFLKEIEENERYRY